MVLRRPAFYLVTADRFKIADNQLAGSLCLYGCPSLVASRGGPVRIGRSPRTRLRASAAERALDATAVARRLTHRPSPILSAADMGTVDGARAIEEDHPSAANANEAANEKRA